MRSANCIVAFTGAGISTESGIPDFRSPGGVWSRHKPVYYHEFLASKEARVRYWKMRMEIFRDFADAAPNTGHITLANLEKAGLIRGVVTQNIDGLHQIAGSLNVIEIHGTARKVGCISCDYECEPEEAHARVLAGDLAPDCEECGAPLKARTISFGQQMPAREMNEAHELTVATGYHADGSPGLFIAIGSSLVVEPAASFPRIAKDSGARLAIINASPTPLDHLADLVIRQPIGATLVETGRLLGLPP